METMAKRVRELKAISGKCNIRKRLFEGISLKSKSSYSSAHSMITATAICFPSVDCANPRLLLNVRAHTCTTKVALQAHFVEILAKHFSQKVKNSERYVHI